MAKLVVLKRRIASVRSTRQITRAMELVAASKLKRAQARAAASRDYRAAAYDLLGRLATSREITHHPLFAARPVKTRAYVVFTSNSGLAGAYNANVLRRLLANARADKANGVKSEVIMIGQKGAQLVRHQADLNMTAFYPFFGDHPTQADVRPVLHTIVDEFTRRVVDQVHVLYTFAPSSTTQTVVDLQLLPAEPPATALQHHPVLNFEPSADVVIAHVATRLLGVQLWQAAIEAQASEQLMRMLAMKSATDNATDLITDYTLAYQTERQTAITQEIAEISGGAEALKD